MTWLGLYTPTVRNHDWHAGQHEGQSKSYFWDNKWTQVKERLGCATWKKIIPVCSGWGPLLHARDQSHWSYSRQMAHQCQTGCMYWPWQNQLQSHTRVLLQNTLCLKLPSWNSAICWYLKIHCLQQISSKQYIVMPNQVLSSSGQSVLCICMQSHLPKLLCKGLKRKGNLPHSTSLQASR